MQTFSLELPRYTSPTFDSSTKGFDLAYIQSRAGLILRRDRNFQATLVGEVSKLRPKWPLEGGVEITQSVN